jgi:hypothetical protein
MQRRYVLIGGAALALLLLAVGVVTLVLPSMNRGPRSPQLTISHGTLKAEPGDTVVTLTWDAVQGAAGYSVFRNDASVPLNPTPVAATHYEDIGLSNSRTYTYTVAPVDTAGKPGERLPAIQVAPSSK